MKIYNLHFKWTISRGRDTYGYNICTLIVNGEKVSSCNGGGYDMQGTCLGEWLQNYFETPLNGLFMEELISFKYVPFNENGYRAKHGLKDKNGQQYSGTALFERNKKGAKISLTLDGGCGFNSMQRIAEAIGLKLQWNKESDRYKNHSFYTAIQEAV